MLEKMQIWAIFLSSKWVVKQQRQLTISTMHLAQELLTKVQYSSASGSFAKEMRGLKMNSPAAGPWKLMTNWEQSLKQILLQLHEKLLKNSTVTIIRSIGICSKLARWKCLISGCLISWLQIKNSLLWSVFSYYTQQKGIISWLDCDMWPKNRFLSNSQRRPAQWLHQEEAPKHFPKSNLYQKR